MKIEDTKQKSKDIVVERRRRDRRNQDSPGYAKLTGVGWYCRRDANRRKEACVCPSCDCTTT